MPPTSSIPPPFDWSTRADFNWESQSGLERIAETLKSSLDGFVARDFQLHCAAKILAGINVVCITATGDGKSALIYIPAILRPGSISVVISPTNFLECDMSSGFRKKSLSSIAINSATLAAAKLGNPPRDLWKEARTGEHQIVLIGPEMLKSDEYNGFLLDSGVRSRLSQLTVDELHLLDEWGLDFRVAYQEVRTLRARLPDHTVLVGLSATIEPGRQFNACIRELGLEINKYHLEKRDCERHNVDLIIRPILHASTTGTFLDLDWLVPSSVSKPSEVPKRIVFMEGIESGHRLVNYLRSLLPDLLKSHAKTLIRHHHSLACDQCKEEGLASLYRIEDQRDCLVHISTDVLAVGVDIPDLPEVVIFGTISTLSSLIQRAGRPAREVGTRGKAIIYLKKSDIEATQAYLASDEAKAESRLLTAKDPGSYQLPLSDREKRKSSKTKKSEAIKKLCPSLRLLIAAFIDNVCLIRQINIIYGNPQVNIDCGRCSSCTQDAIPEPRPKPSVTIQPEDSRSKGPAYMRPKKKDLDATMTRIVNAVEDLINTSPPPPDMLLAGPSIIFPPSYQKKIRGDFVQLMSLETFKERMEGWRYWDIYGILIWNIVGAEAKGMSVVLEKRHQRTLEKQRSGRARKKILNNAGLGHVKRVVLQVRAPEHQVLAPVDQRTKRSAPDTTPGECRSQKRARMQGSKENLSTENNLQTKRSTRSTRKR